MSQSINKGDVREQSLKKEDYYSEAYFSMFQLCSLSHQINEIYQLKPKSILEIGIGNGFVSDFLKKSGIQVTTVDINIELSPDVVSSIKDLPGNLNIDNYDLVVCCEVLEHLPFDEFENSISIFKKYSDKLLLTLPKHKVWFGFSGFLCTPLNINLMSLGLYFPSTKDIDQSECHFWEIDSSREVSVKNIRKILQKHYGKVRNHSFDLCKYHECFICE